MSVEYKDNHPKGDVTIPDRARRFGRGTKASPIESGTRIKKTSPTLSGMIKKIKMFSLKNLQEFLLVLMKEAPVIQSLA